MDFPLPPLFWLTIWLTFLVVFASIAGERRDMQQNKKPRYSIEYQGFLFSRDGPIALDVLI